MTLTTAPTDARIRYGSRRWAVRCVSDMMVMSCGEFRAGPLGEPDRARYHFGPEYVGAPLETVPESHWPPDTEQALITEIGTPGMYQVSLYNRNSHTLREMLEDASVFGRYGFAAPEAASS